MKNTDELSQEEGDMISGETPDGNADGNSEDVNSVKKSSSDLPFILGAIAVIALALLIITVVIVKELNKKEEESETELPPVKEDN